MVNQITFDKSTLLTNLSLSVKENQSKGGDQGVVENNQLMCTHCGKTRHTWETCWKLRRWPTRGQGKGGSKRGSGRRQAYQIRINGALFTEGTPLGSDNFSQEDLQPIRD